MRDPEQRIVLADDDPGVRGTRAELLERHSYQVAQATDLKALLALLAHEQFDLIITDLSMPKTSEFIAKIQNVAPVTPLLLITGQPAMRSAIRAIESNVVAYLSKPVAREVLLEQCHRAIRKWQPHDGQLDAALGTIEALLTRVQQRYWPRPRTFDTIEGLSGREQEVLSLVAGGMAREQVAARLHISENTVRSHLKAVYPLFGVSSFAALLSELLSRASNEPYG